MNSMKTMLRTALLGSVASAACLAIPTFASAAEASSVDVSEIVVTGSRIKRSELTSVQPIQVINSASMDKRGFTNVADAINELPSSGIPTNPIGDQASFSTGRNFVNIFNLGTNRTLTLVNGRRFVGGVPGSLFVAGNTAGGQVDLNVIPTGLVDRIETIQAGGSAVYGSDAVAGVVNIITKTDYEGVEIDGQYGISSREDGQSYRARIIAGHKFLDDKLSLMGSYEYNEITSLAYTDRPVTARQLAFAANPANRTTSDNIPGNIIILNRRIAEVTTGGLPFRTGSSALSGQLVIPGAAGAAPVFAQFAPNGTLVPYNQGTFYQASINSGGDGMNLAELTSLQSPVKRHVATAFIKYDITPKIRFNSELLYSKSNAVEPFNQPIYNASIFGGVGATSGPIQFSTANPFLTSQARGILLSQPVPLPADAASPGDRLFVLDRASVDIGSNKTTAQSETYRGVFAVDGDLDFLHNGFWNASANFGENKGYFRSPNIDQSKFLLAIDAVRDAGGNIVCRNVAARAAGCVPLNLFGLGAPSAAALAYVGVQFESLFKNQQTDYEANFGGDLYQLPAGALSFAAGYEFRLEKNDFNPNDPQERGIGRSAAIAGLSGKYHTSEFYGEGLLPIFGGDFSFPGLRRLELEGSYRSIDHSVAGKDHSWSYGGRWSPFEDLTFRASKSRSFRAPAITEISLPASTSFFTATDPCDRNNINSGPNPAQRLANCQAAFTALGLPANYQLTSQVQVATVQGTTAGSPTLQNEVAKQWTLGFVYQPHFAPTLAIHFDWIHIDISDAIANFNLSSILQVCYDSAPGQDACGRFERGTSALSAARQGQILTATEAGSPGPRTGFINAGYTDFAGFTAGIDYRLELTDLFENVLSDNPGSLSFDFDLYHVQRQQTSVTGLGFDLNRNHGEIGNPKYQWKLETTYQRDNLAVIWTTNWFARSNFDDDFTLETRYPLQVNDYYLNDLAVTYDLSKYVENVGYGFKGAQARVIVKNIFDKEPPFGTSGIGVYDVIGRYYQFGLTARF